MIFWGALARAKLSGDFTAELRDNYINVIRLPEARRGRAPVHI
jgi:hypothetical protein